MPNGFDSEKYKASQKRALLKRARGRGKDRLYVEVGGKIIDDNHATRVLPGYRKDLKLEVINEVFPNAEIVCGVSAKDIDRGRERIDFGLSYDEEVFRLLDGLKARKQNIDKVIITRLDMKKISKRVLDFEKAIIKRGFKVFRFPENPHYLPDEKMIPGLDATPFIEFSAPEIIVTAPGAGSGKFGICLTQLYHEMKRGGKPKYLKIETFPVHNMPINHPLNSAYVASCADLGDQNIPDENDADRAVSYNRDLENFKLLQFVASEFGHHADHLRAYVSATSMGVNFIRDGIVDDDIIARESAAEIARRFMRHKQEYLSEKGKKETYLIMRRLMRDLADAA
ncbi:MAG: DUF1846 domain-containing protein [Proteobacteria bacterium]|nr:DUF1846 domain-containing protein [Pseudomonadota bacterium]